MSSLGVVPSSSAAPVGLGATSLRSQAQSGDISPLTSLLLPLLGQLPLPSGTPHSTPGADSWPKLFFL